MDAKTAKALEGSIKKWERIVRSTKSEDRQDENCPLCQMLPFTCTGCPVNEKGDHFNCTGTPYLEWATHHDDEHNEGCDLRRHMGCKECMRLAKAELEFLKSLREPMSRSSWPTMEDSVTQ